MNLANNLDWKCHFKKQYSLVKATGHTTICRFILTMIKVIAFIIVDEYTESLVRVIICDVNMFGEINFQPCSQVLLVFIYTACISGS